MDRVLIAYESYLKWTDYFINTVQKQAEYEQAKAIIMGMALGIKMVLNEEEYLRFVEYVTDHDFG